ncbi:MAG: ABC transporter permease [Deltaproteobacteria bacterium]|nr:ABC transporter permease [Deltaproteobacteria bacterium]
MIEEERLPVTIIQPSRGIIPLRLREIWEYRELLYFLAWRDIRVRYKQTVLGVAWVVIQPFLLMLVFTFFFGKLAKIPSEGIPYPIFAYTALLPWQLFAKGLNEASTSLVANERIITKVYFPRLIVPASAVFAALVDFAIAFGLLILLMLYYGIMPGLAVLTLPLFVLLAAMTALGVGFWFSALDVQYRDIRYTIPFLTQLWFFATPIVYPLSMVPEKWRILLSLNPMCGVVEGFRWALLGKEHLMVLPLLISVAVVFLVLIGGLYFFRHVEKTLADVI